MNRNFIYATCCVNSTAKWIHDMVDRAREVSLKTLRRHCDLQEWERSAGYDTGNQRGGLRLKDDYHVTYHRSVYRGRKCYFICHSATEYIWVKC